jgi:flavin-binding protein dodecin
MIKTSVLRYAAIGMATMSLAGFAAASSVTVGDTGPDSANTATVKNKTHVSHNNLNVVGVGNTSVQGAASGDVKAAKNTNVGGTGSDLMSGEASNDNDTSTEVGVTNSSSAGVLGALAGLGGSDDHITLTGTGPDSANTATIKNTTKVEVNNTNVVDVQNTNVQGAQSGNVSAYKNTNVGGLSSGAASNTNATTNVVHVNN